MGERGTSSMQQEQNTIDQSGDDASPPQPTETDLPKAQDNTFRLLRLVGQSCEHVAELHDLKVKLGLRQLIGQSPAFLAVVHKIPTLAHSEANILICGETGTGKEVCARAIHYLSARSAKPFIAVNCGAIPAELVENELFGHERGAFTDARDSQQGMIAEAEGGTIFLDEIDSLPLLAQVKLLRFLQTKEYRPLGSSKIRAASVRVICATNANLKEAVHHGTFRQDLYYRINILPVILPPLRERPEDIILLARYFLEQFAAEYGKPVVDFTPEASRSLQAYAWPGNIRELEHLIERAVVLADNTTLDEADLGIFLADQQPLETFQVAKDRMVTQFERTYLKAVLQAHAGNITKAAQTAGKNRRAFWQLLHKHNFATHSLPALPGGDSDKR